MSVRDTVDIRAAVHGVLADVLGLDAARVAALTDETGLFGAMPELDSMAVAEVLTAMEDRLDIAIEDDEVDGDLLATVGTLIAFAGKKVGTTRT